MNPRGHMKKNHTETNVINLLRTTDIEKFLKASRG